MNHDAHITRSRSRRRLSSRKASPSRSPDAQLGRILQPLEELTQGKVLVERDGRLAFGLSLTRAHGGYIDRYVGDAILAIFPDGPDDALQAALAMQRQVDLFNQAREKAGEPPVAIRVGVHSGPLVLGIIGESERLEGTVIADCVNLACGLEGLCKDFGVRIVTTEECLGAGKNAAAYSTRFLGELPVRGKSAPVRACELVV